jgi:hypothetical protein
MAAKWSNEYVVAEHKDLQVIILIFFTLQKKKIITSGFFHLGKHNGS